MSGMLAVTPPPLLPQCGRCKMLREELDRIADERDKLRAEVEDLRQAHSAEVTLANDRAGQVERLRETLIEAWLYAHGSHRAVDPRKSCAMHPCPAIRNEVQR